MINRIAYLLRRAAAYVIDNALILLYALGLAGAMLYAGAEPTGSRLNGYMIAFVTLTGPVLIVFTFMEARWGRTPGKVLLGLRISASGGTGVLSRSLGRNAVKFLPWELAHIGIWMTPGQPFADPPSGISSILIAASYAVILVQVLLVFAFRAGLHDYTSGLRVIRR